MKNPDQYRELMSELGRATLDRPSPEVKAALMREFRSRHRKSPRVLVWTGVAGANAASLIAAAFLTREPVIPQPPLVSFRHAPPPISVSAKPAPVVARRRPKPAVPAVRHDNPAPQEVASDFYVIPYSEPLRPDERADVFRVEMPRANMAIFGLPLPGGRLDSRIKADVVTGEDGVARAVRFVRSGN